MKRIIQVLVDAEEIVCDYCKKPITAEQFVYKIKLADGTIKDSHGHPCCNGDNWDVGVGTNRFPIKDDDWWIKQVGFGGHRIVTQNKIMEEKK